MTEQGSAWDRLLAREQEKEEERLAIIRRHAEAGVVFFDLKTAYICPEAEIGAGTEIGAGVVIEGATRIGSGCRIGHHSRIADSILGNGVEMEQSIVLRSEVGDRSKIGPFAYLRPGCRIVSHDFDMAGVRPKQVVDMGNHTVYLWETPLQFEK